MKFFAKFVPVLSLFLASAVHAIPMLEIDVDTSMAGVQTNRIVAVGAVFDVEIRITGVTNLFAYDIGIQHNDSVLDATGVTEGPFLASNGDPTFFLGDDSSNPVNALSTLIGIVPEVSGDGVLFTIQYSALASGLSPLVFLVADLSDGQLPEPNSIEVATNTSTIRVQSVPLPSTLVLLSAGLAVIVGWRRRDR